MDFKKTCPVCQQKQFTCAFYTEGKCVILNDTKFNRECPFKKTTRQLLEEKEKWSHR